jgi:hypothetical protein
MAFEERDYPDTEGHAYIGRIAPHGGRQRKFSGSVIIMNDITDRMRAEEKIMAQRMTGEALADIRRLRGILPICANCKRSEMMRDTGTVWRITSGSFRS